MKNKKSKVKFFSIVGILTIIFIIFLIDFNTFSVQQCYSILAIFLTIELTIFLIANRKLNNGFINFSFIYGICLFLFNFGQVILLGFFNKQSEHLTIVLRYFNSIEVLEGLKIINIIVSFMYIGIIMALDNKNNSIIPNEIIYNDYVALKGRAKLILLVTFPLKLILDLYILFVGLRSGFDSAKLLILSIPNVLITISNFSIAGFCLLLYAYKNDFKKQRLLYYFLIFYTSLMMLTGRRSINVAYICIYSYIYLCNKKITLKKSFAIIICAFLGLTFLNSLVHMRLYSINIIQSFNYTLHNKNIIFETFREYGNTVYLPLIVVIKWLPFHLPSFGLSYIGGLSAVFPNIANIFGTITEQTNYGFILKKSSVLYSQYYNIGGSNIGELIFNFGVYGSCLCSLLIGVFIGKINSKVSYSIMSDYSYNMVYLFELMCCLLYWIRDYFSGFTREILWSCIFFYVVNKFYKKLERKNKYG